MSVAQFDEPVECDRCETAMGELEPKTTIQFSGGVDAHRIVCHDCIQDLLKAWNAGVPGAPEEGEK